MGTRSEAPESITGIVALLRVGGVVRTRDVEHAKGTGITSLPAKLRSYTFYSLGLLLCESRCAHTCS